MFLRRARPNRSPSLELSGLRRAGDDGAHFYRYVNLCYFFVPARKKQSQFLTTRELAALLRVKERKVYELVAQGALPVRRVTGKLLFPRAEIEEWIATNGGGAKPGRGEREPAPNLPLVIAGGHDPLLEWALRESRSGIAALLDGALDGLRCAAAEGCVAAGLHVPELGGDGWNVAAVSDCSAISPSRSSNGRSARVG
jgi:excisionase family DNA binding protein